MLVRPDVEDDACGEDEVLVCGVLQVGVAHPGREELVDLSRSKSDQGLIVVGVWWPPK